MVADRDASLPLCSGLQHVNLRVPAEEIAALTAFYADIVGLTVGERPPFRSPGVWLYAGGRPIVHLSQLRPGETLPPAGERRSGVDHVALDCRGFDAMLQRLDAGCVPYRVAEVPLAGQRQIFLTDPSGVGVELIFPLEERAGCQEK